MLAAIAATTLQDDDFQEDPTTLELESVVAGMTGKESGLLVLSGTMGNQLSIRALLPGPPHSVLCDHRSHIMNYEAGGIASLCGAMTIPIHPQNKSHVTLEDIERHAVVGAFDHCACPTRLISLENTLAGTILPLSECQRISAWARRNDVKMHLDGARLWEAVAAGAGTLREYCDCFDTVTLCFSKGLGAPVGSVMVATRLIREKARWIRKSIGGGTRQAGVFSAAARQALTDTYMRGRLVEPQRKARKLAETWHRLGGKLLYPQQTNIVWLDLREAKLTDAQFLKLGAEKKLKFMMGGRLVVHYQISELAIQRLEMLMEEILPRGADVDLLP